MNFCLEYATQMARQACLGVMVVVSANVIFMFSLFWMNSIICILQKVFFFDPLCQHNSCAHHVSYLSGQNSWYVADQDTILLKQPKKYLYGQAQSYFVSSVLPNINHSQYSFSIVAFIST
jgi:hypothetical protein